MQFFFFWFIVAASGGARCKDLVLLSLLCLILVVSSLPDADAACSSCSKCTGYTGHALCSCAQVMCGHRRRRRGADILPYVSRNSKEPAVARSARHKKIRAVLSPIDSIIFRMLSPIYSRAHQETTKLRSSHAKFS